MMLLAGALRYVACMTRDVSLAAPSCHCDGGPFVASV